MQKDPEAIPGFFMAVDWYFFSGIDAAKDLRLKRIDFICLI